VQAVEIALTRFGAPVYVRKQIVHNTHVVNELEKRGAVFVEDTTEVPEGGVVVFSAHGIAPEVRNEGHEEVVGTTGEAPDRVTLVDGPEGAASVEVRDPAKVVWLSQTTLSVDETVQTVAALRERFPQLIDPPSDDICYATQNRQAAVKVIARDADVVIVVGSPNSSNSVRLVEVAREAGARAAYLVDDAGEVDDRWLDGAATVGVTSGASVPEDLVTGVLGKLAALGFEHVEEVEAVKERMAFQLPRELRAPQG
jgi:4-hydroxy-3-methylbut-2-enyl diphosphate reductase